MPTSAASTSLHEASWPAVLQTIERALADVIAAAGEGERAFAAESSLPARSAEAEAAWQQRLEQLDGRIRALPACAERAGTVAAAADDALAVCETAWRRWLELAQARGRQLAESPPSAL